MSGLSITLASDASPLEMAAVNAMIAVLAGRDVVVMPVAVAPSTEAPGEPEDGPASSSGLGAAFAPGTSATVPAAPVAIPTPMPEVPAPPAPPAASGGTDVDAEGLPWDARIHGETRAKTAKGLWKRRRNTDDAVWDAVRAELKATMSAGAPPPPFAALAAQVPDTPPADAPDPAQVFAASAAPILPVPTPPAAPVPPVPAPPAPVVTAPPVPDATDATDGMAAVGRFVKDAAELQAAGTLTPADVEAACNSVGVPGPRALIHRPDLVPAVRLALGMPA